MLYVRGGSEHQAVTLVCGLMGLHGGLYLFDIYKQEDTSRIC